MCLNYIIFISFIIFSSFVIYVCGQEEAHYPLKVVYRNVKPLGTGLSQDLFKFRKTIYGGKPVDLEFRRATPFHSKPDIFKHDDQNLPRATDFHNKPDIHEYDDHLPNNFDINGPQISGNDNHFAEPIQDSNYGLNPPRETVFDDILARQKYRNIMDANDANVIQEMYRNIEKQTRKQFVGVPKRVKYDSKKPHPYNSPGDDKMMYQDEWGGKMMTGGNQNGLDDNVLDMLNNLSKKKYMM